MLKSEDDMLAFSHKPRHTAYEPRTLKDYKLASEALGMGVLVGE